jgi:hypothetical protein
MRLERREALRAGSEREQSSAPIRRVPGEMGRGFPAAPKLVLEWEWLPPTAQRGEGGGRGAARAQANPHPPKTNGRGTDLLPDSYSFSNLSPYFSGCPVSHGRYSLANSMRSPSGGCDERHSL